MMKRLFLASCLISITSLWVAPAHADAGLQLNPLKYEDNLTSNDVRQGFIDVANPSDTTVTVTTDVQGFRQADLNGDLAFFDDGKLQAAIIPGLPSFDLGPHEAIRVTFSVDPTKLPQGGVYAAIFFRTEPPEARSDTSYVAESANVGTLLLLQNGKPGQKTGQITRFSLPFWQFGSGITGELVYQNTNRDPTAAAFNPSLTGRIAVWGKAAPLPAPLILPLSARQFDAVRRGSYLGLLPVTIHDAVTGKSVTRWAFVCTGWYQWLLLIGMLVLLYTGLKGSLKRLHRRRKRKAVKKPLDGLRHK